MAQPTVPRRGPSLATRFRPAAGGGGGHVVLALTHDAAKTAGGLRQLERECSSPLHSGLEADFFLHYRLTFGHTLLLELS